MIFRAACKHATGTYGGCLLSRLFRKELLSLLEQRGRTETMQLEVESSPRPYFFGDIGCWSERTEVHKAAYLGEVTLLQRLIQNGASVNIVAVDSVTPLHEAAIRGQVECVRLLLDAGAQVDARNTDGSTPLCEACAAGSSDCVQLLLDRGAKVNPALTSRTTTPLMEACISGNAECVKMVIAKGACLDTFDLYHGTPLHVACSNTHVDCAKAILNAGAKVNAARFHDTALHHAARRGHVELLEMLVQFGANLYARDKHNHLASHYTQPATAAHACMLHYESSPLSLMQQCRICVRRILGTRALKVLPQLDIPPRLINYLSYQ
ncbi:ankyrin repeat and SOCS box protein 13-like isoform X1 [Alosa sapidissima]|uniref:ankyrin repeat and SOCS box protein 13-like isoform X1 n=1 Tax=Alosa sapidissima TaxID=34773 RepID=UPI001C0A00FD|nr:ankyrin repeat and SOCS box protein 13-like isoform X1 [Alosa sapidissima]XP_041936807.1 ankyrin repeat and SOCS box protein 13-like isoform X1 [Alosa sapidissima]